MRGVIPAGFAALLFALPCAAQMYKCVDAKGVTHYSDSPVRNCRGGAVDIRASPPLSGELQQGAPDFAREDADFNRRRIERERGEARERAALEARCRSLRRERAQLSAGGRLYRINPRGEREYVTDEARAQRLTALQDELRHCP